MRISRLVLLVSAALVATGDARRVPAARPHGRAGHATATRIHACAKVHGGRLRVCGRRRSVQATTNVHSSGTSRGRRGFPGPPGHAPALLVQLERRAPSGAARRRRCSGSNWAGRCGGRNRPARSRRRGPDSLEELNGLACHAGGQNGTVSLAYDAAGHASLTCTTGGGGGGGTPLIVINEFSTGVTGAATNEFVELYNAASSAADISGFKVVYRSATGTSTTLATIPAGTQLAAGRSTCSEGAAYAGSSPADQSFGLSPAATGGSLAVRDASGTLVDAVAYGTAANGLGEGQPATAPSTAAAPGTSAIRLPDGHDTSDNAADFRVTAVPTPKSANVAR